LLFDCRGPLPDSIQDGLIWLAAEDAIADEFGKRLTLWSANEDEVYSSSTDMKTDN
jgi:hypothetical protein